MGDQGDEGPIEIADDMVDGDDDNNDEEKNVEKPIQEEIIDLDEVAALPVQKNANQDQENLRDLGFAPPDEDDDQNEVVQNEMNDQDKDEEIEPYNQQVIS